MSDLNIPDNEFVSENHENLEGKVKISEEVIAQIAVKAICSVEGAEPVSPGLISNLRLGRKIVNGIRISVDNEEAPEITIDAYISVKYGLRLPDVCWDVQEAVKGQLEQFTGYTIKAVNVYVHNISFAEDKKDQTETNDSVGDEEESFDSLGEDA